LESIIWYEKALIETFKKIEPGKEKGLEI